jgi:hypothetical protein
VRAVVMCRLPHLLLLDVMLFLLRIIHMLSNVLAITLLMKQETHLD